MVAARQRRDADQRNGQVVGPLRSQQVDVPKRKLAVPTVPTKFPKPKIATHTKDTQAPKPRRLPAKGNALGVRRSKLAPADSLVDAPSIGPKTAARFDKIGIHTVADFLAGSPSEMAAALKTGWISADKLRQWQLQARLVCDIPSLCGYKSQLLVGVECLDAAMLANASADRLSRQILHFAKTSEGKRILRSSKVPVRDDIQVWIDDAKTISSESPVRAA